MLRTPIRFALLAGVCLAAAGLGLAQDLVLDVPYVPTRYPVVDEMLRLARVSKDDVGYDIGCGDGRLVIGAAVKYGARGVGFDIDPERIKECLENAETAGVKDKVRFVRGALFEADFREATVMPMYLLTSVNLKLRPKILREMRPGSRVVSHNFGMDSWVPDEKTVIRVEDIAHDVLLWIVPANVSGAWAWKLEDGGPARACRLEISQKFQMIEGRLLVAGTEADIKSLKLQGDKIVCAAEVQLKGKAIALSFEGRATGHEIAGLAKVTTGGKTEALAWKASRAPETMVRIDDDPSWWGSGLNIQHF